MIPLTIPKGSDEMKRLLSLLLTLTMLLTLTACGGDTASSADQIGSSNSPGLTEWDMHARSVDLTDLYPDAVFVEISDAADTEGITVTNDIVYYEAGRDFT